MQKMTRMGLGLAASMAAFGAQAGTYSDGTIIGIFSNVVTQGLVDNNPSLGQMTYYANTPQASTEIVNATNPALAGTPPLQSTGSKLQWGASTTGVDPSQSFSELIFFGAPIASDPRQPFRVGRLTYLNGTSDLSSLIFGADLSFYANNVDSSDYLGTDHIYITTTSNLNADVTQDADWLNICGNGSNLCNTRIEADEDSEGGSGVTGDLSGQFVGDPTLQLDSVALTPGQTTTGNGFLAPGPTLAVPEPSAWLLLLGAIGGLFGLRRMRTTGRLAA